MSRLPLYFEIRVGSHRGILRMHEASPTHVTYMEVRADNNHWTGNPYVITMAYGHWGSLSLRRHSGDIFHTALSLRADGTPCYLWAGEGHGVFPVYDEVSDEST